MQWGKKFLSYVFLKIKQMISLLLNLLVDNTILMTIHFSYYMYGWFLTLKINICLLSAPIIQHNAGAELLELKANKC